MFDENAKAAWNIIPPKIFTQKNVISWYTPSPLSALESGHV